MKITPSSVAIAVVSNHDEDDIHGIEHSNGNMVSSSTRSNHNGNRPGVEDDEEEEEDVFTEEKMKENKEKSKRRRKNKISILRRIKPWKKIMIAVERQQRIMATIPTNKKHDTTPCEVLFAGKEGETVSSQTKRNGQVPRRLPLHTQALLEQQKRHRQLLAKKKSTKQQKKATMTNGKKKETTPPSSPTTDTSSDEDFPLSSIASSSLLHSYTASGITALTKTGENQQNNDTSMFSIMPCLSSISSLSSSSSDGTTTITMSGEDSPLLTHNGDNNKANNKETTLLLHPESENDLPWPLSVQDQSPESKDRDSSNDEHVLNEKEQQNETKMEEEDDNENKEEEDDNENKEEEEEDFANRSDDCGLSCNHKKDDIHNNDKNNQDVVNTESIVDGSDGKSCNHHHSNSSSCSSMGQQQVAFTAPQSMMTRTLATIRDIWNIVTLSLLIMLIFSLSVTLVLIRETNKIVPTKIGIDFEHSINLTNSESGAAATTTAEKESDLKGTTDQQQTATITATKTVL